MTNSAPRDFVVYDPNLTVGLVGIIEPSKSYDYPYNVTIGPKFFSSYANFPNTRFNHGFNFAKNSTADRAALLESVGPACKALGGGKLLAWELGNEADAYTTDSQGAVRPPTWGDPQYVAEWLNLTEVIKNKMKEECPELARNDAYKYIAPSFGGTDGHLQLLPVIEDGLDRDNDIGIVSQHKYVSSIPLPSRFLLLQHRQLNYMIVT